MFQLKKIDIASVALYSFLMFLILGLIIFLPFGILFSILSNFIPQTGDVPSEIFPIFGGMFFLIMPIFYAVFGTIINVLVVLCYNLLSLKLGGIKIELEKVDQVAALTDQSGNNI
jgi:hypothetical protein